MPDVFLNVLAKQGHFNLSGFKTISLNGSGIVISLTPYKGCSS